MTTEFTEDTEAIGIEDISLIRGLRAIRGSIAFLHALALPSEELISPRNEAMDFLPDMHFSASPRLSAR